MLAAGTALDAIVQDCGRPTCPRPAVGDSRVMALFARLFTMRTVQRADESKEAA